MKENYNVVTLKGTPLILLGEMVSEGKIAPDFTATDNTGKEVRLSDFKGKHIIITSFPSINTPVCATQARRFNIKASSLGDDIVVLGISRDSQEDLHKFCAAEGIKSVVTLSDRKYGDFGEIDERVRIRRGRVSAGRGLHTAQGEAPSAPFPKSVPPGGADS